jgi:PAS domain S-box-containing protein
MTNNSEEQWKKIIGLGASSHRKSYYPELQEQIVELKRKNEELQAMNEEILATEEELRQNYTELQQRENELVVSRSRFQEVLENSTVAFYKRNYQTDIYEYLSPVIFEIIGYTPDEAKFFTVEDNYSRVHPDDTTETKKCVHDIITRGGGRGTLEYRFRHKNGTEIWLKDIFCIVVDPSGNPLYSIGSVQDITEHKKVEVIAKRAQEKLVYLNNVTIQETLNANYAITGYVELLKELNTDVTLLPYLEPVHSLTRKISDILLYAKSYQDLGSKKPAWHNLSIVVLNAISHLDLSHFSREMDLDELECYADPLLEYAFFTIFENVVSHSRNATHLSLRYQESDDSLSLIIEDDGVGIPAEAKGLIFEKSYAREKGMGLFLVREILSLTGISIAENGIPGKGARFEIRIPTSGYRFIKSD